MEIPIVDSGDIYKRNAFNLPSVKTHLKNRCNTPWENVTVDESGNIYLCRCSGWLPFSVGHVMDFSSFDEIFQSPRAQKIWESVEGREYTYCATQACNFNDQSNPRLNYLSLNLSIDRSCNITCPSCREENIFDNDSEIINKKLAWAQQMSTWVEKSQKPILISLGGGDPFASRIYSKIIEIFSDNPRVWFVIATNGLLLEKNIHILDKVLPRTIFSISIDAATKETYEIIRRGGRWKQLLENLEYVRSLKKPVRADFVIQRENFREILQFIDFCRNHNMTPNFTLLEDWGTWHNFEEHCVHLPDSEHREEFLKICEQARKKGVTIKT